MSESTPAETQRSPTHPHVIEVVYQPGSYTSFSRSLVSLPPGALVARLDSPPLTFSHKAYSSVQVSETQHIELNCDFLFVNHSCEPSLEFHVVSPTEDNEGAVPSIEIRVAQRRDASGQVVGLAAGDELTFFYPSTEWEMDQPFDCHCGTQSCKGTISGAKDMAGEQLRGYFLASHIEDLRSVPREGKR